jgi:hypothetical protein
MAVIWSTYYPGLIVMGLGLGATFVSLLGAATAGVPGRLSGLASGLVNTSQQIGGALGLAVLAGDICIQHNTLFRKLTSRNAPDSCRCNGTWLPKWLLCSSTLYSSCSSICSNNSETPKSFCCRRTCSDGLEAVAFLTH